MTTSATPAFSGLVAANAPAAAVAQLVPRVVLPDDVAVAAIVGPDGTTSAAHAALFGRLGATQLRGFVRGDLAAQTGSGVVVTGDADLGKLSRGKLAGRGGAVVAFEARRAGDHAPASCRSAARSSPPGARSPASRRRSSRSR